MCGYVEALEARNGNAMQQVRELLTALNNADHDGRVLLSMGPDPLQCHVQYIMLNAATHFESIVQEAKVCLVLSIPKVWLILGWAGGDPRWWHPAPPPRPSVPAVPWGGTHAAAHILLWPRGEAHPAAACCLVSPVWGGACGEPTHAMLRHCALGPQV